MKRYFRFFCFLLLLAIIPYNASAKNNPFGISDVMLGYYERLQQYSTSAKSIELIDSMIAEAHKRKELKAECFAYCLRMEYPFFTKNLPAMRRTQAQVEAFLADKPYKDYLFMSWSRIVNYYNNTRQYAKAIEEMRRYHNRAIQLKNNYGIVESYRRFGETYYGQDLYNLAIKEYQKGEDFCKAHHMDSEIMSFYLSKCESYYALRNYAMVLKYAEPIINSTLTSKVYKRMARVYRFSAYTAERKWEKAASEKHAITLLDNELQMIGKSRWFYLHTLFNYYLNQNQTDSAALTLAKYKQEEQNKQHIYECQAQWYEQTKQLDSCIQTYKKLIASKDSSSSAYNQQLQAQMANTFEVDRLELERKDLTLQRMQDKQNMQILVFVILGMLLLTVIIYATNRRKQLKAARLQRELAEKAQQQAEELQQKAEQANHIKTLFLQNMSHEIRTPLNAIVGFNDILNSEENIEYTDEERKTFLDLIHENTNMLTTLVNDLLDMSRLQSGNYRIHCKDATINSLCSTVISSVEHRVPDGVTLSFQPPMQSEQVSIYTDVQRVQQVLINFLTNAIKHTDKGSIVLSYALSQERGEEMVTFSVTDTGEGIPEEQAENIFERFEKLDTFKQGTGLGLNICKLIAKLLDGRVWLDTSYQEQGCRFKFKVPRTNRQ